MSHSMSSVRCLVIKRTVPMPKQRNNPMASSLRRNVETDFTTMVYEMNASRWKKLPAFSIYSTEGRSSAQHFIEKHFHLAPGTEISLRIVGGTFRIVVASALVREGMDRAAVSHELPVHLGVPFPFGTPLLRPWARMDRPRREAPAPCT